MAQVAPDIRDGDAWRREQLATIGGSNAAAAVGRSPWTSRAELFRRMRRARRGEPLEVHDPSDDMRRGSLLEPIARQLLSEALCLDIQPHNQDNFVTNPGLPWAHALPDGWKVDGRRIIEIKVPRPATWSRVALEGLPPYWLLQGLHNIAVCDVDGCDFGLLDPISMRILHLPIDRESHADAIAELMRGEAAFWLALERDEEPDDETQPAPSEPPAAGGEVPKLTGPEAERAAAHYERCRLLAGEADEIVDAAKRQLCILSGCTVDEMGEISGGPECFEVPGIARIYHKTTAGARAFNRDAAIADYPALKDEKYWKRNRASRSFRYYTLGHRNSGDDE